METAGRSFPSDATGTVSTPAQLAHWLGSGLLQTALIAIDAHGRIAACSDAAAALCGLSADALQGQPATQLPAALVAALQAGTGRDAGVVFRSDHDGTALHALIQHLGAPDQPGPCLLQLRPAAAEDAREQQLRQLAAAMDQSDSAIMLVGNDAVVAYANAGFSRVFGHVGEQIVGRVASQVLSGPHTDPEMLAFVRERAQLYEKFTAELLLYRRDGTPLWASIISTPLHQPDAFPYRWLTVLTDITHSKMHEMLHHRVLDAMVREQPVGDVLGLICTELERVAPGLRVSVLALDAENRLRPLAGPSLPDAFVEAINGVAIGPATGACGTAAWRGRPVTVTDMRSDPLFADYRVLTERFPMRACWSSPVKSSGGRVLGTFAIYYDVPREPDPWHIRLAETCLQLCALALEREQTRARVHQLAFYDALTNLPNRMMFSARAEQLLIGAEGREEGLAVMFLDVDRFKRVNETQGHAAGDGLLRDLTERVTHSLDAHDLIGRQAGDEFVLALPHCTAEQAGGIAERLLGAIAQPAVVGRITLHPSASIGVAMFPGDGRDIDTLLRHADLAMHRAKSEGGGSFRFFSAEMNRLAQEHVALETALREAIRRDQLELHYQPQVDAADPRKLHGVEVLLRWNHPQMGRISPARFIPLAEESGLIGDLGRWVLRTACRQLADWRKRGVPVPRMAVNLSAGDFEDPHLLVDLLAHLHRHGLTPGDITLEMTESAMLSPQPEVFANINAMRDAGLVLSLDDFGTGYSSLSHLHRLPINEIKLDMSFVRDLEQSEAARALTNAVLRIGDSLGKQVVAEGVETERQRSLLAGLGCQVLQGFLFSPPLEASALEAWIAANARD